MITPTTTGPRRPSVLLRAAAAGTALVLLASAPAAAGRASTATVAQPVAGGLAFPAAFTFAPDGRIFYGERFTGEIRVLDPATGQDTLFFTLPAVATSGEQGLLGLALHHRYPRKPLVYAFYTKTGPQNLIVRIRDSGGTGADLRTLVTLPAGTIHNGGVIHFGPDRMLYAVVGEVGVPANAQLLSTTAGKVLRMTDAGRPPRNNPFAESLVYSFGHRNMFGFAWDHLTRRLWVTENGPECNDEVNLVVAGGNYAWGPNQTCAGSPPENTNQDGPSPRLLPEVFYGPPMIAPTGAAFCRGCGLPGQEGNLIFGAWNDGILRSLVLDAERDDVASQSILYDHPSGVLAVERGPDGALYFSDPDEIFKLVSS
ncbi:MAG: PQQ-dependent sugar dehydrogenase [Actinomycetota bacterium]